MKRLDAEGNQIEQIIPSLFNTFKNEPRRWTPRGQLQPQRRSYAHTKMVKVGINGKALPAIASLHAATTAVSVLNPAFPRFVLPALRVGTVQQGAQSFASTLFPSSPPAARASKPKRHATPFQNPHLLSRPLASTLGTASALHQSADARECARRTRRIQNRGKKTEKTIVMEGDGCAQFPRRLLPLLEVLDASDASPSGWHMRVQSLSSCTSTRARRGTQF
jgi:hypothetical protein